MREKIFYTLILIGVFFISCDDDDSVPGVFLLDNNSSQIEIVEDPDTGIVTFTNQINIKLIRQSDYSGNFSIRPKYVSNDDNAVITNLDDSAIDTSVFTDIVNDEISLKVIFKEAPVSQYLFFDIKVNDREEPYLQNVSFVQQLSKRKE